MIEVSLLNNLSKKCRVFLCILMTYNDAIPIIYSVTLSILVINVSIPYFFVLSIAISMMIVRSALPAIFSNHNNGLKNVKASSVKNIKQ